MRLRLILVALLAAGSAIVYGQSKGPVVTGGEIDNQLMFGRNVDSPPILPQRVLRAKQGLRGLSSAESVIRPDASVADDKAFVTTPGFPNEPAAIGPIENIELNGGQAINFDGQDPVVAHAVRISTQHPRVRASRIVAWRGIGIQLVVPPAVFNASSAKIESNVIEGCYTGIAVSSDQEVLGNTILACRDYGLVAPNPAGNVTIANNHFYGCNGRDERGQYDGKCVYMPNGSGWRLIGNTLADSHYGFVSGGGGSHTTTISACTFFKNSKCAIQINGGATNFRIDGCTINVPPGTDDEQFRDITGVELAGNRNSVSDSIFFLDGVNASGLPGTPNAGRSTALRVSGHANTCVNTVFLDYGFPAGKARGIHIPAAAGGPAVRGFRADVQMWGFEDPGDVFLDIDTNDIKGVHIVIRGNSVDSSAASNKVRPFTPRDIAQYVDIPAGWDGKKNSITLIDEATNTIVKAIGGKAY
jgi:hypothetical protein